MTTLQFTLRRNFSFSSQASIHSCTSLTVNSSSLVSSPVHHSPGTVTLKRTGTTGIKRRCSQVVGGDTATVEVQASTNYIKVINARFYELGLIRELTNPRVGVIPSLFLD